ncbi:MAG: DCC1-like thiol-disulfide oxidoreductase family protein [Weeksellaceae bacterium]|nr:DCC1-like thiol-disulfide oxidoreductase family protein [Weeksellaceae bacterium]
MTAPTKYYVFYDGDCGFCNYWVQWIIEKDRDDRFLFSALQSDFGQQFLRERGLQSNQFNTLYLWKPHAFYLVKSKAVLEIAKILGGTYGLLAQLNIFPRFFSDKIYDKIAANRLKLSSQKCFVPNEAQRKKMIS